MSDVHCIKNREYKSKKLGTSGMKVYKTFCYKLQCFGVEELNAKCFRA